MERPSLEVADLFNMYGHHLGGLSPDQYKVVDAIKNCRTKALGGHIFKCQHCDYQKNVFNSCRNRHCPKCQFLAKINWIEKRKEDLLPCPYYHAVFTVPSQLRPVFLMNKEACYNLLFKASSETLKVVAKNSKNLKGEIGFIGVLHTWGQNLQDHPHIHYILPGGTLDKDNSKWRPASEKYLLPVKVLSKVFRGLFLKGLQELFNHDELKFAGDIDYLAHYANFQELLSSCATKDWNVYCESPFAGPEQVIDYLGGYTHRIAISNYRLVALDGDYVVFKVRDKGNRGKSKTMRLRVVEFLRRFLLHVLPKGFVRIRHFGLLGNRWKKEKIQLIRKIEEIVEDLIEKVEESWQEVLKRVTGIDVNLCPNCKAGQLAVVGELKGFLNSS